MQRLHSATSSCSFAVLVFFVLFSTASAMGRMDCAKSCPGSCSKDAFCSKCKGFTSPSCCNGRCVDKSTDSNNCGACGNSCSAPHATTACLAGVCVIASCAVGFADCDGMFTNGCEVPIGIDQLNCGQCGRACNLPNAGSPCENGTCVIAICAPGFADCDNISANGCETNLANHCPLPNVAFMSCDCQTILACFEGFGNCNGILADGCETSVRTDANCGECGRSCAAIPHATATCGGGRAVRCLIVSCEPGFLDCNNFPADGCEVDSTTDRINCGACGVVCSPEQVCTNGGCQIAGLET